MLAFYTKLDMLTRMGGALSCYCCLFFLAARRTSDDWPFARDACGTETVFSSCRIVICCLDICHGVGRGIWITGLLAGLDGPERKGDPA